MTGLHNMFENMLFSEEARKDAKTANMGEKVRGKKSPGLRSWQYGGNQRFEPALLYDACTTCRIPTDPKNPDLPPCGSPQPFLNLKSASQRRLQPAETLDIPNSPIEQEAAAEFQQHRRLQPRR